MYAGDMDGNCLSTAAKQGPLRFVNCKQVLVDATHVENFYKLPNGSRPIEVGLNVESSGGAVLISPQTSAV